MVILYSYCGSWNAVSTQQKKTRKEEETNREEQEANLADCLLLLL